MKTTCGTCIVFLTAILSASAAYQFAADGGTFVVVEKNGAVSAYQLGPSTGGEPHFDGTHLGTYSLADSNRLVLSGFTNYTYESGGHSIFSGGFVHSVHPVGGLQNWATNFNNGWAQVSLGWERHYATNLNINLLAGLSNGTYELEVYAFAQGNFSPDLLANNGGSNFVAHFTVTEDPLPEPEQIVTGHGKVLVDFAYTTNTGYGNELYVVGNHPDVGNWNPVLARKLTWNSGNVWTGRVAIEAGHALAYKFLTRTNWWSEHCDGANADWMGGANLSSNLPAMPDGPYSGKAVYLYAPWTNAAIWYTSGLDTNLFGYINGTQDWDRAAATGWDYITPLDAFLVQDHQVYTYWPQSSVSSSRIESTVINSSFYPPINGRLTRIYLPRGYDQNTWKRYPVLYMHDGTNVFQPGGLYGTWSAETNADHLIGLGQMRETIIVGVDNSTDRSRDYIPPGDDAGAGDGWADDYGHYLVHDVKRHIDATYRTLSAPDDTVVMGSSFGGLVSLYLGLESNVFGRIGAMSTAYWPAPNFIGRMMSNDTAGARIYMDQGTGAYDTNSWTAHFQVYDMLLRDGYVLNDTLRNEIGCGHAHSEWAWDLRLPMAYEFLLPATEEPNLILQEALPRGAGGVAVSGGTVRVSTDSLKGQRYRLERTADFTAGSWQGVATSTVENLMWSTVTLLDATGTLDRASFYRIVAQSY